MSSELDRELESFSTRLRSLREGSGLTQASAAEAIGATKSQWSNWETGRARPYFEDLAKVARLLDVSAHWLLFGEGPREASLLALAASAPDVPAGALAGAIAKLPADELQRLADARRAQEVAAWNDPIRRGIEALEEALGANPPLPMRDEINRSIERLRRDLRGESSGSGSEPVIETPRPPGVRYHSGPVQREGYVEERSVDYERESGGPKGPGKRRKKG